MARGRATRTLTILLGLAIAVSIVHCADNHFDYAEFPDSTSGPEPSKGLVGASWFAFAAAEIAGYVPFRKRGATTAALRARSARARRARCRWPIRALTGALPVR